MTKISQLADIGAGLAAGDEFIIRDVSDVSTPNKKVTASGFLTLGAALGLFGGTYINAGATGESRVETVASGISGYVVTTISGIPSARTTISGYYENASGVVSGVFYPVVTQVDIGTAPNQVPVNGFLGTMAFQDAAAVNVDLATITTATISSAAVTAFSNVPLLTGGGLKFPATQVASADPNTLDDYEEGTFTPTIIGSTTAGTVSYYDRNGNYTKIGRVVYITLYVNWISGTGTGDLRISGLPFTGSSGGTNVPNTLSVGFVANLTAPAGTFPGAAVDNGNAYISIHQQTTAPVYEPFNRVNIAYDGQANFMIHGFYLVS